MKERYRQLSTKEKIAIAVVLALLVELCGYPVGVILFEMSK